MHSLNLEILLLGALAASWLTTVYAFQPARDTQTQSPLTNHLAQSNQPSDLNFDCRSSSDVCYTYSLCDSDSGQCLCPPGFGGDDCSLPLCGALSDGDHREPPSRGQQGCQCKAGWTGVNCNVCESDEACQALAGSSNGQAQEGVVCNSRPLVARQNYQTCLVTNRQVRDLLNPKIPEATFSCDAANKSCNFQRK